MVSHLMNWVCSRARRAAQLSIIVALAALLAASNGAAAVRSLQQTVNANLISNALAAYQNNPQGTLNALTSRECHPQLCMQICPDLAFARSMLQCKFLTSMPVPTLMVPVRLRCGRGLACPTVITGIV